MPGGIAASRGFLLAVLAALAVTGCGTDEGAADEASTPAPSTPSGTSAAAEDDEDAASASFRGPDGAERGTVELDFDDDGTTVVVEATGLTPGPHGFHIHAIGTCEPDSPDPATPANTGDFLSAGGHLAKEGQVHSGHDGDLSSLMARADGTASLTVTTDTLRAEDVLDGDGSAAMIHALADNFSNIPERYAPGGPDEMTNRTGDSGGRVACAELTPNS